MPIFNLFSDITYNLSNVDSSNHLMLFKLRLGTLVKTVPMCDSPAMAQEISVIVGAVDPARSAAIVGGRSRPLEHVRPARPVLLLPAVCVAAAEVARRTGVGEPAGGVGDGGSPSTASTACCAVEHIGVQSDASASNPHRRQ